LGQGRRQSNGVSGYGRTLTGAKESIAITAIKRIALNPNRTGCKNAFGSQGAKWVCGWVRGVAMGSSVMDMNM